MRFSALLFLAALPGALVYAAEPEGTTTAAKPASPRKPAQDPQSATPSTEELNPLRLLGRDLSRRQLLNQQSYPGVRRRRLFEGGAERDKNLKNLVEKFNVAVV
uniref:Extracellular glycoprotein lacritin isoform X1 n=1 Tax=Callorhinus ursinus TaxID=34884 RepID=A0A3Q7PZI8_CALUR|nr:extracellular glycoprotein lacritin isoform X1 [Callorhinus ursinus]